jgi:PAT family beta-lactamase induction signal transducer AmpG
LSTLFSIPRILAGPVAGVSADAFGWRDFFVATLLVGVPGLLMLARFVPWSVREVHFEVRPPSREPPLGRPALLYRGLLGGLVTGGLGLVSLAALNGLSGYRVTKSFDLGSEVGRLLSPAGLGGGFTLLGLVVLAVAGGLVAAATAQARRAPAASE